MKNNEDFPVSDAGSILGSFLKNVGWWFRFTWKREGDRSNLDCDSEFILNSDEPERLSEKKQKKFTAMTFLDMASIL
ncbi:MAG: hypothetical protein ACI4LT_00195 [Treponema sp.]